MNPKVLAVIGIILVLGIAIYFSGFFSNTPEKELTEFSGAWKKSGLQENLHQEIETLLTKDKPELDLIKKEIQGYSPKTQEITALKEIYLNLLEILITSKEIDETKQGLGRDLCGNVAKYESIIQKIESAKALNSALAAKVDEFRQKFPDFSEKIVLNEFYFDEKESDTTEINGMISTAKEACA